MKNLLILILVALPIASFAVDSSTSSESAPVDPCAQFKTQVANNYAQIQSAKAAGEDGKIPALHQANVAIRKAHPECFAQ